MVWMLSADVSLLPNYVGDVERLVLRHRLRPPDSSATPLALAWLGNRLTILIISCLLVKYFELQCVLVLLDILVHFFIIVLEVLTLVVMLLLDPCELSLMLLVLI
jgi:hypothetical protein